MAVAGIGRTAAATMAVRDLALVISAVIVTKVGVDDDPDFAPTRFYAGRTLGIKMSARATAQASKTDIWAGAIAGHRPGPVACCAPPPLGECPIPPDFDRRPRFRVARIGSRNGVGRGDFPATGQERRQGNAGDDRVKRKANRAAHAVCPIRFRRSLTLALASRQTNRRLANGTKPTSAMDRWRTPGHRREADAAPAPQRRPNSFSRSPSFSST